MNALLDVMYESMEETLQGAPAPYTREQVGGGGIDDLVI